MPTDPLWLAAGTLALLVLAACVCGLIIEETP